MGSYRGGARKWEGGELLPTDSVSQRQKFLFSPSLSPLHLWHCIFKALSNTCADNVLPSWSSRVCWTPGRTVPGRAFPLHAKHFWPLSRRPQKSASSAYKLITCSKRFEWLLSPAALPPRAEGTRHGELNGFGFGFESVSLTLSFPLPLCLSVSSFFSSRTRRFYDIPILI